MLLLPVTVPASLMVPQVSELWDHKDWWYIHVKQIISADTQNSLQKDAGKEGKKNYPVPVDID